MYFVEYDNCISLESFSYNHLYGFTAHIKGSTPISNFNKQN